MPALLICSILLLTACGRQLPAWHSGKLVVVVPEVEQGAEAEFERELAQLFAGQLHAALETVPLPQDKISAALTGHRAHLAAASLRSEFNNTALQFGSSYQSVSELVVCNRDNSLPETLVDLEGKGLAVVAGSAQEVALREAHVTLPALQWQARPNPTPMDLFAGGAGRSVGLSGGK